MKTTEYMKAHASHTTAADFEDYSTVAQWWRKTDRGFDMIYFCGTLGVADIDSGVWADLVDDLAAMLDPNDQDAIKYQQIARTSGKGHRANASAAMLAGFISGAGAANNNIADLVRKHIACPC